MPISRPLRFTTLLAASAVILAAQMASAQEPETIDLFDPARSDRTTRPVDAEALGMMPGTVGEVAFLNLSAAAADNLRSGGAARRLRIALPGGGAVTCNVTPGQPSNGIQVLRDAAGDAGVSDHCYLLVKDGRITGDIQSGSQRFRIVPAGLSDTHAVVEVRSEGFPQESDIMVPDLPRREGRRTGDEPLCDVAGAGDRGTIDLMILYTPATAARQDMDVLVAEAMAQLQSATAMPPGGNFGVNVRLVHSQPVAYVEGEDLGVDLERLSGKVPGHLENVAALRDLYKADIVHLIVEGKGNSCGIGWMVEPGYTDSPDYAFSVTDRQCAVGNYSFAHEIGHNLGMNHDRHVVEDADVDAINFGFISLEAGKRTLMAYDHQCREQDKRCPRVLTYSTPSPIVGSSAKWGVPPSQADSAYNREILCRNAPGTAEYR